jgi:hypothetical protein
LVVVEDGMLSVLLLVGGGMVWKWLVWSSQCGCESLEGSGNEDGEKIDIVTSGKALHVTIGCDSSQYEEIGACDALAGIFHNVKKSDSTIRRRRTTLHRVVGQPC